MSDVAFPTPGGYLRGHLAVPSGEGPWPAVVVLHEAFGLNGDIRGYADRFAACGYMALAPDLFSWGATPRCLVASFRALLSGQGRVHRDVDAAGAWLTERDDTTASVGVVGFCMGGGLALLAAPRGQFGAASVNYGFVPRHAERLLTRTCPMVACYGGRDRMLRGHAARLNEALRVLGVDHDVVEYPAAGHSFLNRHLGWAAVVDRLGGAGYRPAEAEEAWGRILAFFDRHLADTRS